METTLTKASYSFHWPRLRHVKVQPLGPVPDQSHGSYNSTAPWMLYQYTPLGPLGPVTVH
jgi:hypothetical protein